MTNTREERVATAMQNAELSDGEGNTYRLFDLLDFSGENKSRMIVQQLARIALSVEPSPDVWEAIETFSEPTSPSSGNGVLVADADGTVGEAYFRNFGDDADGWWWANTSRGDYPEPDQPRPTHWQPMPDPPKVTGE